jgi:hypothetical protein
MMKNGKVKSGGDGILHKGKYWKLEKRDHNMEKM